VSGPSTAHADRRRVTVLASGGGRSLDNLAQRVKSGALDAELVSLVCDRSKAGVLDVAARHGIESVVIRPKDFAAPEEFSRAVFARIEAARTRLVVLAGFLRHLLIPKAWLGHVINIHPSLLPRHGGPGYFGEHVHRAVLAAGDAESGCTVHFVDDHYDNGPQILQKRVPVLAGDDVHTLAARVFAAECEALPEAVARVLTDTVSDTDPPRPS
jgi:phosphoribosylglycinamide formyltransferase-1